MDYKKYKYATLEEAEQALLLVNNYFKLPMERMVSWTTINEEEDYFYLQGERLKEVLGEPVEI
jgi:hypothetical protein